MNLTLPANLIEKLGLKKPDEKSVLAELGNRLEKLTKLEDEKKDEGKEGDEEHKMSAGDRMEALRAHLEEGEDEDKKKEMLAHLEALEEAIGRHGAEEEEGEEGEEDEDKKEKAGYMSAGKVDGIVKRLVAKELTRHLSKIGGAPKASAPAPDAKTSEVKLTAEQEASAKKLGVKPEDYAKQLQQFRGVQMSGIAA